MSANIFQSAPSTDLMANYNAAQASGHHVDCDGYMLLHRVAIERVQHGGGKSTWRAVCEECGNLHPGTYGQEADCKHYAQGHAQDVPCDGRCHSWN